MHAHARSPAWRPRPRPRPPRCRRGAVARASRRPCTTARCASPAPRDGATVAAAGLRWHAPRLPRGMSLLSFAVAYSWQSCDAAGTHCRAGADSTAAPFAARRYAVGHADTGRRLRLTETAAEVVQTQRNPFTFQVIRRSVSVLTAAVRAYPRHGRRRPRSSTGPRSGGPPRPRSTSRWPRRTPTRPTAAVTQRYRVDRGPVAGPAEEPRVLHRHAAARAAPGGGAHAPAGPARPRSPSAGRSTTPAPPLPCQPGARATAGTRRTWTAPATRCAGTGRSAGPPRCSAPGAARWTSTTSTASSPPGPRSPRSGPAGRPPPCRTRARSATSTWPGRTTARTPPRARIFPAAALGQRLLRLPRGALGRPAPARRAQADAARARRHVRAEGVRRG